MSRSSKAAVQAAQEEREKERDTQFHQNNLNGMSRDAAHGIYDSMLEDIVETSLKEGSKEMMRNLLTKDFVLANLTNAEVNEFKWKLQAKQEFFFWMHPSEECLIVGDLRAAIYDDPSDRLRPLTPEQKWEVLNVFDGIWMRVTRARGMKQQELLNTQIRESRLDRDNQSRDGIIAKIRGG